MCSHVVQECIDCVGLSDAGVAVTVNSKRLWRPKDGAAITAARGRSNREFKESVAGNRAKEKKTMGTSQ